MSATMFRGRAMQRVSSPEQLDRAVRSTRPLHWLALVVLLAVVAATIVWASLTTLPTTLTAQGEYLPTDGLDDIQAVADGTVTFLDAMQVGATVTAGDVLASVAVPQSADEQSGEQSFDVMAPSSGTIVAVNALNGTYVTAGQNLASIEPAGQPLVVYAYLPADDAAVVGPDTEVRLHFGAGVAEVFGSARGVVQSVSRYPATLDHVRALINVSAVEEEVADLGQAREIVITPMAAPETASGVAWARGTGPPVSLPPGLPVSVEFVVGTSRPIDRVL